MKINMKINYIHTFLAAALCSLIFISCSKEVSTTPEDLPAPTGIISIASDPPGAAIYINGKNTGRITPDSMRWLKDDSYKITLRLKYFRDTVFSAIAGQNKRNQIKVDYFGNPLMYGSISCSSVPKSASIIINGAFTGKQTPFTFNNLRPGIYSVGYEAFGCRQDSQYVTVESSKISSSFLELVDTTIWLNYNKSNSPLPIDIINCIAVDMSDIVWIGTNGSGLVSFDGVRWKTYTPDNSSIPGYGISCITFEYVSAGRRLWIGTNEGLAVFDGTYCTVYNTTNSQLPDNYVNSIAKDFSGNFWVGTNKGIAKIPRFGAWTIYNTANSKLPDNVVTRIAFDASSVWIGTNDSGLVKFSKDIWTTVRRLPSITALWTGLTYGGVWAGYYYSSRGSEAGGIYVYEGGNSSSIEGLPGKKVECIVPYEMNKWIGTNHGLVKMYGTTVQQVFNKDNSGLPEDHIMDAAFDSEGKMWIATFNSGIVKYKAK